MGVVINGKCGGSVLVVRDGANNAASCEGLVRAASMHGIRLFGGHRCVKSIYKDCIDMISK